MWSQACVTTHGGALESHRSDPGGTLRPSAQQGPLPLQHEVGTRWHLFFFTCVLSMTIIKAHEGDVAMFLLTQESLTVFQEDRNKAQSLQRIEQASACFRTSVRSSVIKMQKWLWVAQMTSGMWSKPCSFFVSSLFHTVSLYLLLISSKTSSSRFGEIILLYESILFVKLKLVLRRQTDVKWLYVMWCKQAKVGCNE